MENKTNSAQLWKILKGITGGKVSGTTDTLNVRGTLVCDSKQMANELNHFFVSVGVKATGSHSNIHVVNWTDSTLDDVFCFDNIEPDCIEQALNKLGVNKATGIDGLSTKLLKTAGPAISVHLSNLFNSSLQMGCIPDE